MEKKTWEVPELQEIDVRLTMGGGIGSPQEETLYGDMSLGQIYDRDGNLSLYYSTPHAS